jgi:hypothetical protein
VHKGAGIPANGILADRNDTNVADNLEEWNK